jgi:hypothetical protein
VCKGRVSADDSVRPGNSRERQIQGGHRQQQPDSKMCVGRVSADETVSADKTVRAARQQQREANTGRPSATATGRVSADNTVRATTHAGKSAVQKAARASNTAARAAK